MNFRVSTVIILPKMARPTKKDKIKTNYRITLLYRFVLLLCRVLSSHLNTLYCKVSKKNK